MRICSVRTYRNKGGQIDYMTASHYDADHIGGMLEALELFNVENVIEPAYEYDSNLYRSFLNTVLAVSNCNDISCKYDRIV